MQVDSVKKLMDEVSQEISKANVAIKTAKRFVFVNFSEFYLFCNAKKHTTHFIMPVVHVKNFKILTPPLLFPPCPMRRT